MSFHEYIEGMFGYAPRSTQDKLRVAEALEQLPAMARALEQGRLNWSAVRELTRVAVAETESKWLAATADKTVRQIQELVAGATPGDLPSSPRDPALRPRVLRFEVTAETYALFREAASQLRRRSDARLDDDALLLTMARAVLQGPNDEGRSSYQVSLRVCPECGAGAQLAAGDLVPVSPEVTAMAECDGQHIGSLETVANDEPSTKNDARVGVPARAKQTVPPAKRRAVMQRDHHRCRVPGCRNATFVDVHTSRRAPTVEGTMSITCSSCARRTIARCIAVSSCWRARAPPRCASVTPTAAPMANSPHLASVRPGAALGEALAPLAPWRLTRQSRLSRHGWYHPRP